MINEVVILGKTYTIEYVPLDEDLYGDCKCGEGAIRIRQNMTYEQKTATIVHEVLHAILFEAGIAHMIDDSNQEEGIVRAIEHGLIRSGIIREL
jgi:hypothetical protein